MSPKVIFLATLALGLSACAGEQTRAAFTLRAPAYVDSAPQVPNSSALHEASLRDALQRAIDAQDRAERNDQAFGDRQ